MAEGRERKHEEGSWNRWLRDYYRETTRTLLTCGGLNVLGLWEVALLGGVALLEELCHCLSGFLVLKLSSV